MSKLEGDRGYFEKRGETESRTVGVSDLMDWAEQCLDGKFCNSKSNLD